jgi:hypothetical protein
MLVITDFQWLGEIAKLGETMQRQTHDDRCSRIDFMLDTGENYRARNLALQLVEKTYPLSPEIQYRACLACARAGGTEEAMRLADRFGFNADLESLERAVRAGFANPLARRERDLGEDNRVEDIDETEEDRAEQQKRLDQLIEDISVLAGRLAKDAAFASAPGTERNASLTRAMNRYNDVYERTQRPFSGINAASMAAMLGQTEKATRIAKLVKSRPPSDLATYWHAATRAEVSALLGDTKDAKAAMALAAGMKDATIGRRSSTRKQLIRLRGAVVSECLDALLEGLPVPIPIVYSGHLMLGSQLAESAQRDAEHNLVANLKAKLKELGVGSAYGALAAGSDIVIAEEVLKHGAALHVVLPRRFAEFVKASVEPGDPREAPGHWRRRFDNCLAKATSVTILHEGTVGAQEQDAMFQAGFRLAAGLAFLQADELVTRAAMLAVYDGGPVGSIAGTAMALQAWRATSEPLHELPCSWRRPGKGADVTAATPFRPVIFIWAKPSHKAKATSSASTPVEFLERAVATAIGGKPPLLRKSTDDCMVALVCGDVSEAARLALQLAQKLQGEFASLSIVCDFGPALDSKGAPSSRRMADMRGASEMPDVPPGGVSTTEGFAAEARLDTAFAHRLQPMGRIAVAATRQTTGMPLPSIRMFQLLAPPAAGA